jgi:hypothetical protein
MSRKVLSISFCRLSTFPAHNAINATGHAISFNDNINPAAWNMGNVIAIAANQPPSPKFLAYVQTRQLVFVFGKGMVNTEQINLAANFKIESCL